MKYQALLLVTLPFGLSLLAQDRGDRYAIVLTEPPAVVARAGTAKVLQTQRSVRASFSGRGVREVGSIQTLANAIFVETTPDQAAELARQPGVKYVQKLRYYRRLDQPASQLVNAPAAWAAVGGQSVAGAGIKIGILDTGIDQTHPAFQDASLNAPSGYPRCSGADCAYTSSKVIVARSFVDTLVYLFDGDTRPDDTSPRDRTGHGTAVAMLAAGVESSGPAGATVGVAPKAYLGNYKVFGSPGVNDFTADDVILRALEAAYTDGMDIVNISLGAPAIWGPSDSGSICGNTSGVACDLQAEAIANATRNGMVVVAAAGNTGDTGLEIPALGTVESPGTAPEAITVGAITNSRVLRSSVSVPGGPSNLQNLEALFGTGPTPSSPLTAPLRDVARLGNDGKACQSLSAGSLNGAIALVLRGDCTFATKVANVQAAGAAGALVYLASGNAIFSPTGLAGTGIPMVMIGNSDGVTLKNYAAGNSNAQVTLNPALRSLPAASDELAIFSSQGPSIGEVAIKPELSAVGTDMYMATQNYDPNSGLYDASRYAVADGTSFAAPMVAGAVALVKQRRPALSAAELKSAVVNTANPQLTDYDYDGTPIDARVLSTGAGKLDAASAVNATLAATPATLSFGVLGSASLPRTQTLRVRNTGSAPVTLSLSVAARGSGSATVSVSPTTAFLAANATGTFTVTLSGSTPSGGIYEGVVNVTGGGSPLRIPYLFLVGDGVPFNAFALNGDGSTRAPGRLLALLAKFVDRYGVPVPNLRVQFRVVSGGGSVDTATSTTDDLGIAEARVRPGTTLGQQVFSVAPVSGGDPLLEFLVNVVQEPVLTSAGVVNAASGTALQAVSPGSYISLFGSALASSTAAFRTPYLPISLAGISVGFDVPSKSHVSYPGRLSYASPGQVNVLVPWEVAGESQVQFKVSNGDYSSSLVTFAVAPATPGFFEYTDPGSNRQLIAALDQNYGLVTAANPVRRGQIVQLYANGLGAVDNQPATGEAAPSSPLATCRVVPTVTIGGQAASVQFAGLAPGFVGLYQINAIVPESAPAGIQPAVISVNGVTSKTANLPVQ